MSESMWIDVALPLAMAVIGWLSSSYRNKQKKENDIIANFQLMRDADKEFMTDLKLELSESKKLRQRLETKLDRKNKSIRKANQCPHTIEGDGCPVLIQEEKNEYCYGGECANCSQSKAQDASKQTT